MISVYEKSIRVRPIYHNSQNGPWRSPKMFNKFYRSGYMVLLLYALGAGFWIGAFYSKSYRFFFCAAVVCIVAGFLRSLNWLWHHQIFVRQHVSSPYTRRYSDNIPHEHTDLVSHQYAKTHGERRRRRRRRS